MGQENLSLFLENTAVRQYKTDIGFKTLVDSVNDNMYVIPKYQRKYRWDKTRVEKLVESLLLGLPIPPIYTCRNEKNQLEILDGQQRVMSLFFYYIGYYLCTRKNSAINFSSLETENSTFRDALMKQSALEELHIELEDERGNRMNVDYANLPVEIRRKVDYTTITVIEIKVEQEEKRTEILRKIFANLNRGGMLLSDQEQRNGIYDCRFYDMLQEFNRHNEKWRSIWGRESSKERDMEMLLRFCALKRYVSVKNGKFEIEGYKSNFAEMLDRFSGEAIQFKEEEIRPYQDSLTGFVAQFENCPTFSSDVALLESFYVLFEVKKLRIRITRELCEQIQSSADFKKSGRQGTTKIKTMDERWKTVYEISVRYHSSGSEAASERKPEL